MSSTTTHLLVFHATKSYPVFTGAFNSKLTSVIKRSDGLAESLTQPSTSYTIV
jgi:hypothetical protein